MSRFKVALKQCGQCLLTDQKVVTDERRDQILKAIPDDGYFVCHKDPAKQVCCSGYYTQGMSMKVRFVKQVETQAPGFVDWVKL